MLRSQQPFYYMKQSDKENLVNFLYEDNHILVLIKESNISTQPTDINPHSLQNLAKDFIKEKYKKKGDVFLHPVHRLDKAVCGIVLFAKTSKALKRLNEQMREKKIIRKYIAEVEGKFLKKQSKLKDYIVHLSHRAKIVKKDHKGAKLALLAYTVIKETKNTTVLQIELFTGRYHQIRTQFSNISHPILGDTKYGSKKAFDKIHLCSYFLEFSHPIQKKRMTFEIKPFFLK